MNDIDGMFSEAGSNNSGQTAQTKKQLRELENMILDSKTILER